MYRAGDMFKEYIKKQGPTKDIEAKEVIIFCLIVLNLLLIIVCYLRLQQSLQ